MSDPVAVHPVFGVGLMLADLVSNFRMENLSTAARHRAQPGVNHLLQNPFGRLFGDEAEPVNFDSSPGFDVDFRTGFMQNSNDVHVPVELHLVVQATDDVNFRGPL